MMVAIPRTDRGMATIMQGKSAEYPPATAGGAAPTQAWCTSVLWLSS
jgi:hypothetical protein